MTGTIYTSASPKLWLDIQNDQWFSEKGCVTLFDRLDSGNTNKKHLLCDFTFGGAYQSTAYATVPNAYLDKVQGIGDLYVDIHSWKYNNGTVITVENSVDVRTPRVTAVSYSDNDDGGSAASITMSMGIRSANGGNACIVDKGSSAAIECGDSASVSGKSVTVNFKNDRLPTINGTQLVISSGFAKSDTKPWPISLFTYEQDVTYTGSPLPSVTSIAYNTITNSTSTLTASEDIMEADHSKICILNKQTQIQFECSYAASASGSAISAKFYNNGTGNLNGVAAELVIYENAIQDLAGYYNGGKQSFDITYYGVPTKPGMPTKPPIP